LPHIPADAHRRRQPGERPGFPGLRGLLASGSAPRFSIRSLSPKIAGTICAPGPRLCRIRALIAAVPRTPRDLPGFLSELDGKTESRYTSRLHRERQNMNGRTANDPAGFWNRDFILAFCAYFGLYISMTMFYIYPLYFQRYGTAQGRIGLIMGVHSLLAILVRPLFGRVIDARGGPPHRLGGNPLFIASALFHLVRDAGWLPFVLRAATGMAWGVSITATMSSARTWLLPDGWPNRSASSASPASSAAP